MDKHPKPKYIDLFAKAALCPPCKCPKEVEEGVFKFKPWHLYVFTFLTMFVGHIFYLIILRPDVVTAPDKKDPKKRHLVAWRVLLYTFLTSLVAMFITMITTWAVELFT